MCDFVRAEYYMHPRLEEKNKNKIAQKSAHQIEMWRKEEEEEEGSIQGFVPSPI